MIHPDKITRYGAPLPYLQELALYCVAAAGKPGLRQARCLRDFLLPFGRRRPFAVVRELDRAGRLADELKRARIGQYTRIGRAFAALARLDVRRATVEELEAVPGVGPKTARMLVLHSRPGQRVAVLDTHILRWLREQGVPDVPKHTPPAGKTYRRLEAAFLALCDAEGRDPAEMDLAIWTARRRSSA